MIIMRGFQASGVWSVRTGPTGLGQSEVRSQNTCSMELTGLVKSVMLTSANLALHELPHISAFMTLIHLAMQYLAPSVSCCMKRIIELPHIEQ